MKEDSIRKLVKLHLEMFRHEPRSEEDILTLMLHENEVVRKLSQETLASFLFMSLNSDHNLATLSMSSFRDMASLAEDEGEIAMASDFDAAGKNIAKDAGINIGRTMEAKKDLLKIIADLELDIDQNITMGAFNLPSSKPN